MIKKHIYRTLSEDALEVYRVFSTKEGAQHIAKPPSIQAVTEIIRWHKPKTILEVGGGIGALSFVCLKHSEANVDIFEDNIFCIGELRKNLRDFDGRYTIHSDYSNYSLPHLAYDLVIFDGGTYELINQLTRSLTDMRLTFFEGNRIQDRAVFRKALKENYVFTVREYIDSSGKYKGGHEIRCKKSKSKFLREILYRYWEVIYYIREVVWNALNRRVARLKNLFAP